MYQGESAVLVALNTRLAPAEIRQCQAYPLEFLFIGQILSRAVLADRPHKALGDDAYDGR